MKRKIIASIIGVGASVALVSSSYGQGQVAFENYATDVNAPVTFATAGTSGATTVTAGEAVGSEFTALLLYSLNGGSTWETLASSATPFLSTDGNSGSGAGYFLGGAVTLPDYTSGSVMFQVEAYSGASYGLAGFWSGTSATFSEASISSGALPPPPTHLTTMTPWAVSYNAVPEPTTLALGALGGMALLAFRRRKA